MFNLSIISCACSTFEYFNYGYTAEGRRSYDHNKYVSHYMRILYENRSFTEI